MCSGTSQPPRRDLYDLATELGTSNGPFFMPSKPGRIAGMDWMEKRPHALAVWNASYTATGHRCEGFGKPWTVMGPDTFQTFTTHAEALAFAIKETV